jgi:solute carrier family 50 protein (sugar transporter)
MLIGILDVGFLAAAVLVCQLLLQGDMKIDIIGFLGAGLNVVMYGSPLAAMVRSSASSSIVN